MTGELDLGLPTAAQRFKVGDHVHITGRRHPWRGHSGTITAPFRRHGLDWVVAIDGVPGRESCIEEGNLRHG